RYGLAGERPDISVQHAKGMVVYRYVEAADKERLCGFLKLRLVVVGIDPQLIEISSYKTEHFHSHQSDMGSEGEVSGDELGKLGQSLIGPFVYYHPYLNRNTVPSEVMESEDRLLKRASSLNDVVVFRVHIGI